MVTNLALMVSVSLGTPQIQYAGMNLGSLVRDRLFNEAVKLDRAADQRWVACRTAKELSVLQQEVRQQAVAAVGGFPEKTPLNARTTGLVRKDGYTVEKVYFESRPNHHVTAHLFLPDSRKYLPPYPGVVSPCGHSFAGKNAPAYQRVGVTGAKLGFATLVYDPVEQGERHQLRDGAEKWSTAREHCRIGKRAALLGWNAAQFRIWDGIRALDYLVSRLDVDARRVGVLGLSGGGTLSAYLNALENRFCAAAPAGFLSTIRDVYDNSGPQDAEQVIFGQLKFGFNHLGMVTMRAPSPVMIIASHADFFPFMGAVDTFENAQRIYGMLGVPESVELMHTAGPHTWYESTRNAAFLWMRRWAANDVTAWPADRAALRRMDFGFKYDKDNSALAFSEPPVQNVTESGCVLDLPGSRSVYDIMRNELARVDAKRMSRPALESVRLAAGVRPLDTLKATPTAVKACQTADGKVVQMLLVRDDDLVPIPLVAFLPENAKGTPVLLCTDAGRKSLETEVRGLLDAGHPVAVAEMRGFGESARGGRSVFHAASRNDEELAMLSFAIGENIVARRAEDIAVAARHFCNMVGSKSVELSAAGAAAIPAAHAFFLERRWFRSFETKSPPPSWHTVVERPELPFYFADSVHGALRVYDWVELAKP